MVMKLMKLKLICKQCKHCKPIDLLIYKSAHYWFTVGLHCLQSKNKRKNSTVNIVNQYSTNIKNIKLDNQVFMKFVYKVYNVYGQYTIYSHAKKSMI
jgi:hypothetical protein